MTDVQTKPFPIRALTEPRHPWRAILVGWVATTIPALLLSWLVTTLLPGAAGPRFPEINAGLIVLLVLIAPLIETLIMATVLEILLLFLPGRLAVIASSIGWGIAHSIQAAAWGLVIWWPFLIFSTLYVAWRGQGRMRAILIVFAVHALNNLLPALLLLRSV